MKTAEQVLEWIEDKVQTHKENQQTCYTTEAYDEVIRVLKYLKTFILTGED
jgi:hypothetical protein